MKGLMRILDGEEVLDGEEEALVDVWEKISSLMY